MGDRATFFIGSGPSAKPVARTQYGGSPEEVEKALKGARTPAKFAAAALAYARKRGTSRPMDTAPWGDEAANRLYALVNGRVEVWDDYPSGSYVKTGSLSGAAANDATERKESMFDRARNKGRNWINTVLGPRAAPVKKAKKTVKKTAKRRKGASKRSARSNPTALLMLPITNPTTRGNPPMHGGAEAAPLQQKVAALLNRRGMLTRDTRFSLRDDGALILSGATLHRALNREPDAATVEMLNDIGDAYGYDLRDTGSTSTFTKRHVFGRRNPTVTTKAGRKLKVDSRNKTKASRLLLARKAAKKAHKRMPRAVKQGRDGKGRLTYQEAMITLQRSGQTSRKRKGTSKPRKSTASRSSGSNATGRDLYSVAGTWMSQ